MSLEPMQKAVVLIEVLPYIQRFNREIAAVKYGGSATADEELKKEVIQNVVLLKLVGFKPIIIHEGGKKISCQVGKVGIETRSKNGFRVTDEPTMKIVETVLNKVNRSLIQLVSELDINAMGISGKDDMILKCHKKCAGGEDIGFVGDVGEVNPKIIYDLLGKDFLSIICPTSSGEDFLSYNINADDAACAVATAVEAGELAFLTDVESAYRDYEDKSSLISKMTVKEAQNSVDNGILGDGTLPKLQDCVNAIKNGVSKIHILDGRIPHYLLLETFTDKGIGIAIYNSEEDERYYHG